MLDKPEALGADEVVETKYPKEQRKKAKCTTKDEQFKTTSRSNQYFTLYVHRLEVMRPALQERAKQKWPSTFILLASTDPCFRIECEIQCVEYGRERVRFDWRFVQGHASQTKRAQGVQ